MLRAKIVYGKAMSMKMEKYKKIENMALLNDITVLS